jgi:hypothetical protein
MATAVTISPVGIQFFLNNQGQPNAGGTLLTQVGGVNTATYQDAAGNTPLPNPIPLNSRGEISNAAGISCQLFLQTGIVYTFTLFDAAGNQLNQPTTVTAPSIITPTNLADSSSAVNGAGLVGFNFALFYAANTAGWGIELANRGYNMLQNQLPANWAGILAGTDTTTDHSAGIIAGIAAATAANRTPFFPGKRWNYYTPTTFLELPFGACGDDAATTSIYVDASTYAVGSVVFRLTQGNLRDITIREKNLDKTRAILVQATASTVTNAAGGAPTFTAYLDMTRVWVFGGLIAFDIGPVFTCEFKGCRFGQAGTGVNIVPNAAQGFFNTLVFDDCEIADNNKNWNAQPSVGSHGLSIRGGSTERCLTTSSNFTNITTLTFLDHYQEQAVGAISPITITSCNGVYARFTLSGSNCDLTLGTNTTITIDGWVSGVNHLLGGDGTQNVTISNSTFPATGNAAIGSFALFSTAGNASYNGQSYGTFSTRVGEFISVDGYSASITPNFIQGTIHSITANNGTAFTINAPINGGAAGTPLTVTIRNTSGGSLGVATWNAIYKLAAWTQPANGLSRTIWFYYDGTNYIERSRTTVDVPN